MKSRIASACAVALFALLALASRPVFAMGGMMPTCAVGDPVVGVNTRTKMYMSHAQMKKKMAGMTMAQRQMMMQQHHVVLMCKSKAYMMGARPM
jgi:hypothetical protein